MKRNQSKKTSVPAEPVRRVYEAYAGPNLDFDTWVVTEGEGVTERVLCAACVDGEDDERVLKEMREQIEAAACDPKQIPRLDHLLDYNKYGRLDSTEPMPARVYEWRLAPLGSGSWTKANHHIAPFCPIRLQMFQAQRTALLAATGRPLPIAESFSDGSVLEFPWVSAAHREQQSA